MSEAPDREVVLRERDPETGEWNVVLSCGHAKVMEDQGAGVPVGARCDECARSADEAGDHVEKIPDASRATILQILGRGTCRFHPGAECRGVKVELTSGAKDGTIGWICSESIEKRV